MQLGNSTYIDHWALRAVLSPGRDPAGPPAIMTGVLAGQPVLCQTRSRALTWRFALGRRHHTGRQPRPAPTRMLPTAHNRRICCGRRDQSIGSAHVQSRQGHWRLVLRSRRVITCRRRAGLDTCSKRCERRLIERDWGHRGARHAPDEWARLRDQHLIGRFVDGWVASAALMSAAMAGSRRSLSRQRLRFGPMVPTGIPSLALISA